MSTPTEMYAEIEQALGTPLVELVNQRRAARVSWRLIAIEITERTGVDVAGETLRIWHLGIPARAERAEQGSAA